MPALSRRQRLHIVALVLAGAAFAAPAEQAYRWKDRDGVVHYGDHAPESANVRVERIPLTDGPHAAVRLRIEDRDGRYSAWADNALAGPVEVLLQYRRNRNFASVPALPARAVVPAGGSVLIANLFTADSTRPGDYEVFLDGVPGDPSAKPREFDYLIPLPAQTLRIDQGFGGGFSHADPQNRYALDFAAPIGTPVMAARAGTVMQIESDFAQAGLSEEEYGGRANFVRILHDDGTMALYAHLQQDGALVRVGQRIRQGQQIGLSGNTGFTSGPHLHFAVQVNRGMRLESIPFRMRGPEGVVQFAR
ncbi:M23 family metallopeptidase [Luteimonas gilva]|uniref:M23 family metallopeptidase n=1 Tax=Luteimonas gilva TaxID=2572684 RepID=A0A4U5JMG5_9GAMM|nr:M23 family metallopeptidase [Luteimonas gilva]TKR30852.1 M23 family metallopeptidase [Luteimonas gilva]